MIAAPTRGRVTSPNGFKQSSTWPHARDLRRETIVGLAAIADHTQFNHVLQFSSHVLTTHSLVYTHTKLGTQRIILWPRIAGSLPSRAAVLARLWAPGVATRGLRPLAISRGSAALACSGRLVAQAARGPHQRDIASFFGGRPKTNPATLPSMFASKSKSTVAAAGAPIKVRV